MSYLRHLPLPIQWHFTFEARRRHRCLPSHTSVSTADPESLYLPPPCLLYQSTALKSYYGAGNDGNSPQVFSDLSRVKTSVHHTVLDKL